uniref:Uncharacterized protein n=1 Tax=Triatoma infestans TaxID=30076 RepID=A0A170U9H4_TRIIF
MKINVNYAPLRGVPGNAGVSGENIGPLCCRC